MPWFKVDDKMHDHRKVRAAGVAAIGLWTLAGSWSMDNLHDGFVPESVCARWDRSYRKLADRLVKVGLWVPDFQDDEDGWSFHDWADRQPSRASIVQERSAAAERQRKAREAAKSQRESRRDKPVTHDEVPPIVTVPPSRPVPSQRTNLTSSNGSSSVPAGAVPRIIRAYVDACTKPPAAELQNRIEQSARSLLGQGFTEADVVEAARSAGQSGWTDLATQMQRDSARSSPATPKSTADARFHEAAALADRLDQKAIQS